MFLVTALVLVARRVSFLHSTNAHAWCELNPRSALRCAGRSNIVGSPNFNTAAKGLLLRLDPVMGTRTTWRGSTEMDVDAGGSQPGKYAVLRGPWHR